MKIALVRFRSILRAGAVIIAAYFCATLAAGIAAATVRYTFAFYLGATVSLPSDLAEYGFAIRFLSTAILTGISALIFAIPFAAIAIITAKLKAIVSWGYFAAVGLAIAAPGALLAFIGAFVQEPLAVQGEWRATIIMLSAVAGGLCGGLVYWFIAVRKLARREHVSHRRAQRQDEAQAPKHEAVTRSRSERFATLLDTSAKILGAYVCATLAAAAIAAFVLHALAAYHGIAVSMSPTLADDNLVMQYVLSAALISVLSLVMAAPPAALAITIGKLKSIQSGVYYAVVGLLIAVLGVQIGPKTEFDLSHSILPIDTMLVGQIDWRTAIVFASAVAGGLSGGILYWFLALRNGFLHVWQSLVHGRLGGLIVMAAVAAFAFTNTIWIFLIDASPFHLFTASSASVSILVLTLYRDIARVLDKRRPFNGKKAAHAAIADTFVQFKRRMLFIFALACLISLAWWSRNPEITSLENAVLVSVYALVSFSPIMSMFIAARVMLKDHEAADSAHQLTILQATLRVPVLGLPLLFSYLVSKRLYFFTWAILFTLILALFLGILTNATLNYDLTPGIGLVWFEAFVFLPLVIFMTLAGAVGTGIMLERIRHYGDETSSHSSKSMLSQKAIIPALPAA